jgi:hypothetical protein
MNTSWINVRIARPPAPYFIVMRSPGANRSTDPSWRLVLVSASNRRQSVAQVWMPAVLMPDAAGAFAAHHARADGGVGNAGASV